MRHARHDEDILDLYPRCARHFVSDQIRAFGNARHAQAAIVHAAACLVIFLKNFLCHRMQHHGHTKRRRNRIDGNVIMRRPNTTGSEQIVIACTQCIHCLNNRVLHICDHAHFAQANALHVQPQGDLRDIFILRAARQDLIADDNKGCGIDAGVGHVGGLSG